MIRYRVKYYDARLSKKGQGVQRKTFDDKEAAEAFAAKNRVYAKPCRVEEYEARDPKTAGKIVDLFEALKQSLEAAKEPKA